MITKRALVLIFVILLLLLFIGGRLLGCKTAPEMASEVKEGVDTVISEVQRGIQGIGLDRVKIIVEASGHEMHGPGTDWVTHWLLEDSKNSFTVLSNCKVKGIETTSWEVRIDTYQKATYRYEISK